MASENRRAKELIFWSAFTGAILLGAYWIYHLVSSCCVEGGYPAQRSAAETTVSVIVFVIFIFLLALIFDDWLIHREKRGEPVRYTSGEKPDIWCSGFKNQEARLSGALR